MRKGTLGAAALLATIGLLTGCGDYGKVEPERLNIDGAYSVRPPIVWNQLRLQSEDMMASRGGEVRDTTPQEKNKYQLWTVDGANLDALWFFTGLEDGETLFLPPQPPGTPAFDRDMKANDVMQLVVDTLARSKYKRIETKGLRPASFGAQKGFRFEFSFRTRNGLIMKGMALGTVADGRLYLITFHGSGIYHFDRYRDAVEGLFASIQGV